ncbi:MAG: DinB family protein [Phycisphaerales bacterium]|nr:DinB family protein [Phycisphaerales bacterium]
MTTRSEILARMIGASVPLTTRYFAGFTDANRAAQLPGLPNHFAWTLGHCSLTMHRLAERLDGRALPESDFQPGVQRAEGSAPMRFGTEGVAFNSVPSGDAGAYPTVARCIEVFEGACARLGAAVRGATDQQLDAMQPWGAAQLPMADLILRITLHNAMHSGQLVDLRRGLGLGRVIG